MKLGTNIYVPSIYDKSYEKIDDYKAISHSVDVYSRIKYGIKAINRGM